MHIIYSKKQNNIMKSVAVQEAILTIGMALIGGIMIATQVPAMTNDIQSLLSKESTIEQSKTLANLLSIATASPNEIKFVFSFPIEKSYNVSIKNGYVNVSSENSFAAVKTLAYNIECNKDTFTDCAKSNVQKITIIKNPDGITVE